MRAWIIGASGAWGRAIALRLLHDGYDVVALGRRDVPALPAWAVHVGREWRHVPLDLADPDVSALPSEPPDLLFSCAIATDGDRASLMRTNFLGPAAVIERAIHLMAPAGGQIGVLLGQNARLGMTGLGDVSAGQAALWTWCEALQADLRARTSSVTLTCLIPPRTASPTQRLLAERSGHRPSLRRPNPEALVTAVLNGKRRGGRWPLGAAASMLLR
jgi:NAD(P)-dependent dehydrogenase (short-subunit alcohol dehydrogenase family)